MLNVMPRRLAVWWADLSRVSIAKMSGLLGKIQKFMRQV